MRVSARPYGKFLRACPVLYEKDGFVTVQTPAERIISKCWLGMKFGNHDRIR